MEDRLNIKQTPKCQFITSSDWGFWPPFCDNWKYEDVTEWIKETLGPEARWSSRGLDYYVPIHGDTNKLWTDDSFRKFISEHSDGCITIRDLAIKTIYDVEVTDDEGQRYY